MPRRVILSSAQRTSLEQLPTEPAELVKYYTFSQEDLVLIQSRRKKTNQLGFALQLCLVRYPGRTLRASEELPYSLVAFVAEQTNTDVNDFTDYAHRDQTRRAHIALLMKTFGLSTFTMAHFQQLIHWLIPIAQGNPRSTFLVGAVLNQLRHQGILHPPLAVVERIVAMASIRADRRVFDQVNSFLSKSKLKELDQWLLTQHDAPSKLSWVRQAVGHPSPANILAVIERIDAIRKLGLTTHILHELPQYRQSQLAKEGRRVSVQNLRTFSKKRRYAIITVTLLDIHSALVDEAIMMHDQMMMRFIRKAQRKHAEQFQQSTKRIKRAIKTFTLLTDALHAAKMGKKDIWQCIEAFISWEELQAIANDAEALIQAKNTNHLYLLEEYYSQIRRYAPTMIGSFEFKATASSNDIVEALQILHQLNLSNQRKVPAEAPISFIPPSWKPLVLQHQEGINRRYYELCLLNELRNRLRSGDIWVEGSRQYQEFDSHLLEKIVFSKMRSRGELPIAAESDFSQYIDQRQKLLEERLSEVHKLMKDKKLEGVDCNTDGLSIKPHRGVTLPQEVQKAIKEIYDQLPQIKITDLLVEVDSWTGFTEQFTHLRTELPAANKQGLFSVILSEAINLGLTRMSEASPGSSLKELSWIEDWHIRDECYTRALAELVNYHHSMELVNSWGHGTTSSSDGQQFSMGSVARELGHINPKYGSKPGAIFYTHISDQYTPFHTKLISASSRDATFVLDGLLYHESKLNITEHYTDTSGFTDHVFGLCHLLGFRFAPRIRGIGALRLHLIGEGKQWPLLAPVLGEGIKVDEIKSQWDEILRLASSIKVGSVTASLIISKLASYPRQNRLALALRELGRVERTLFILDWIRDPQLRARTQAGLNKGESRNALARVVFFNRLGEIRDRSFEDQSYRASGLNLVVLAIILWNTVYLEKAIKKVSKHREIPQEWLSHLSPICWQHISLTGDYIWKMKNP